MNNLVFALRMKKVFYVFVFLIQFGVFLSNVHADEGAAVIVNATVSEESLSKTDVMNIFLGKKTTWGSGSKITFVTLKDGETHKVFLRTFVNRNPSQFKNHWKKMLFTGKGVIPKAFDTDKELLDFVSQNENTIGYVSKGVTGPGIKIIEITN